MFTTIINDCKDDNARGRQESRVGSLLGTSLSFIGVDSDLEAGVQLIDVLDATEGRPGLVLVNVAPRGGHTTQWENGTPFVYFWHHKTLVVASADGHTLSGIKAFSLTDSVNVLDTRAATTAMQNAGFITAEAAALIPTSQFRSFDFTPRVGAFMFQGNELPSEPYDVMNAPDLPPAIWHIDNFGNAKTTLTRDNINPAGITATKYGDLPFHQQLRNLPDGATALIEGSSGFGQTRFIEVMTQRGNFAHTHGANIGDDLFTDANYFTKAT